MRLGSKPSILNCGSSIARPKQDEVTLSEANCCLDDSSHQIDVDPAFVASVRLRDAAYVGGIDKFYAYCPIARSL